jgi:hypothetical protein
MTKQNGANSLEARQDRRDWLSTVCRWTLLAGITAIAGVLVSRNGWRGCVRAASMCADCQLLAHCQLPQAQGTRDESREERAHG